MLLDENIKWWYVIVAVILLIPLLIGCTFFILFFSKDSNETRGKLDVACYLAIISFTLLALWNLTYFILWFKAPLISLGTDATGYREQTKKQYIFCSLFIACWLNFFYGYFVCVTRRYWYRLRNKEGSPVDNVKPEEKKSEEKQK